MDGSEPPLDPVVAMRLTVRNNYLVGVFCDPSHKVIAACVNINILTWQTLFSALASVSEKHILVVYRYKSDL